jgi:hypothetical protein
MDTNHRVNINATVSCVLDLPSLYKEYIVKGKILLVLFFLTFVASIIYLLQAENPTQNTDLVAPAETAHIPVPFTDNQPEPIKAETQIQQPEGETIARTKQNVSKNQPLSEQLCASYTKPVCLLKDDIQLQQHLLRDNNLFLDSAALVIGSSNFAEALLELSSSKTENEDFSTEQDIRDYLTKELTGEVYTLQLGCGIGICMAAISTGPESDLAQDRRKIQGFGASVQAEFKHHDHKELRLIFLAGKNANNGMTATSKSTSQSTP